MRQFLRFSISSLAFLLFAAFSPVSAACEEAEAGCPLNPPGWLSVVSVTPVSVDLDWPDVPGAASYKLDLYDETNGVPLPSIITGVSQYNYGGLTPGHKYKAAVASSACPNGPFGESVSEKFTTPQIIIDMIVELSCPLPNTPEQRVVNQEEVLQMVPANSYNVQLQVWHVKVRAANSIHFVEFSLWADCDHSLHLREISASNGLIRNPVVDDSVLIVEYRFPNQQPFFKLSNPQVVGSNITLLSSVRITYQSLCSRDACNSYTGTSPCSSDGEGGYNSGGAERSGSFAAEDMGLSVAPNPFGESFRASYFLPVDGPVRFQLFDAMGRLTKTMDLPDTQFAGAHETRVDGADLPPGVYFLVMQTERERRVATVIKQE